MFKIAVVWMMLLMLSALGLKVITADPPPPIDPLSDHGSCVDPDGRPLPCQPY